MEVAAESHCEHFNAVYRFVVDGYCSLAHGVELAQEAIGKPPRSLFMKAIEQTRSPLSIGILKVDTCFPESTDQTSTRFSSYRDRPPAMSLIV
jgi:hypothetical protein